MVDHGDVVQYTVQYTDGQGNASLNLQSASKTAWNGRLLRCQGPGRVACTCVDRSRDILQGYGAMWHPWKTRLVEVYHYYSSVYSIHTELYILQYTRCTEYIVSTADATVAVPVLCCLQSTYILCRVEERQFKSNGCINLADQRVGCVLVRMLTGSGINTVRAQLHTGRERGRER